MSQSLSTRSCTPCREGTKRLDATQAAVLAASVPDWSVVENATRIERRYRFADFASAFAFVRRVAAIAEAADHHPDIGFGWGYANLALQTHAIGGLHENDFIVAARCDLAAAA